MWMSWSYIKAMHFTLGFQTEMQSGVHPSLGFQNEMHIVLHLTLCLQSEMQIGFHVTVGFQSELSTVLHFTRKVKTGICTLKWSKSNIVSVRKLLIQVIQLDVSCISCGWQHCACVLYLHKNHLPLNGVTAGLMNRSSNTSYNEAKMSQNCEHRVFPNSGTMKTGVILHETTSSSPARMRALHHTVMIFYFATA